MDLKENEDKVNNLSFTPTTTTRDTATSMSVIHLHQSSVIQAPSSNMDEPVVLRGNTILMNEKLHAPVANLETLHSINTKSNMEENRLPDEESLKERREKLIRRPSYRKILNDISRAEFSCSKIESSGSECDSAIEHEISPVSLSAHSQYSGVPSGHIQLTSRYENSQHIPMSIPNSNSGGPGVQYDQERQFYVSNELLTSQHPSEINAHNVITDDQVRKRELRLLKNREAARECRRKKKEYIKCLENRVAVLENQNKSLIEELKTLKELYCHQKCE